LIFAGFIPSDLLCDLQRGNRAGWACNEEVAVGVQLPSCLIGHRYVDHPARRAVAGVGRDVQEGAVPHQTQVGRVAERAVGRGAERHGKTDLPLPAPHLLPECLSAGTAPGARSPNLVSLLLRGGHHLMSAVRTSVQRSLRILLALAVLLAVPVSPALSAEPLHWQWRNVRLQGNHLHAVALGDGRLVAVGQAGTVLTSRDEAGWVRWRPERMPT
jgi:hypothetical protein